MRKRIARPAVLTAFLLAALGGGELAHARGGHGGGGFHGGGFRGGFGGYRGGFGGYRGGFGGYRAPAFSAPRAAMAPAARPFVGNRIGAVNVARVGGLGRYGGYHQGWWHGGWNSNYYGHGYGYGGLGGYGGYGGYGLGLGMLGGLALWGLGSSMYSWGLGSYMNPYYGGNGVGGAAVVASAPYDYSQPLAIDTAPPDQAVADPAVSTFDSARAAFMQGDYRQALQLTDQALAKLPDDPAIHEFRALCLFALKDYDQAAATLYAVLSAGTGWDWTTLVGLYPSVDVYTEQLRALESYASAHPESAAARFVLAYQYETDGFTNNAVKELKQVVKLKPDDRLSAQLASRLEGALSKTPEAVVPPSGPTPTAESLVGSWTAHPNPDTTIALTRTADGNFTWTISDKKQTRKVEGVSTYGNGILTLARKEGGAIAGQLTSAGDNGFQFKVSGAPPDEPALEFRPSR